MSKIKAFIICFNRLTSTKAIAGWLADNGCEVILLDNGSTYEPLLEWYAICPYKIHRFEKGKYNHKVLWSSGLVNEYPDQHYIVTDHDLDLANVPGDFVEVLLKGLQNPGIIKSGLSLKIDDLPKNSYTKEVIKWESKFWKTKQDANGFYFSDIDTTLALYDRERTAKAEGDLFFRAVRTPEPYTAKHLPWYITPETITPEEQFYIDNIGGQVGYWTHQYKRMKDNGTIK